MSHFIQLRYRKKKCLISDKVFTLRSVIVQKEVLSNLTQSYYTKKWCLISHRRHKTARSNVSLYTKLLQQLRSDVWFHTAILQQEVMSHFTQSYYTNYEVMSYFARRRYWSKKCRGKVSLIASLRWRHQGQEIKWAVFHWPGPFLSLDPSQAHPQDSV